MDPLVTEDDETWYSIRTKLPSGGTKDKDDVCANFCRLSVFVDTLELVGNGMFRAYRTQA